MKIIKTTPIYIPYFLYTFDFSSIVSIASVYEDRNHFTHYKNVKKKVRIEIDKVPIDGSVGLEDHVMMSLFPYNYDEMIKYEHEYLSGHISEMYDEPKEKARNKIIELSKNTIRRKYMKFKSKSNFTFSNSNINAEDVDYILLPVWMIEVTHAGKTIKFYMNGQTKKLIGKTNYLKNSTFIMYFLFIIASLAACILMPEFYINIIITSAIIFYLLLKTKSKSNTVKNFTTLDAFEESAVCKEETYY